MTTFPPESWHSARLFCITLGSTMGQRRGAVRGSFIDSSKRLLHTFYGEVVQVIQPWRPNAPQIKPVEEGPETPAVPNLVLEDTELVTTPLPVTATAPETNLLSEDSSSVGAITGRGMGTI